MLVLWYANQILGQLPAITGALAVVESGADTASMAGSTGPVPITGLLSVTEAGNDTAAFVGGPIVSGVLSVSETGSDTFAGTDIYYATPSVRIMAADFELRLVNTLSAARSANTALEIRGLSPSQAVRVVSPANETRVAA